MKPRCELMVKKVLPAIRVAIVKELVKHHKLTQSEVAKRLGITQPAVSQYLNKIRGLNYKRVIRSLGLSGFIVDISKKIANEEFENEKFSKIYCMVCSKLDPKVFEE